MSRRRKRNPGSVWMESRRLDSGRKSYRIRWIDPATHAKASENCGTSRAYARTRRAEKHDELLRSKAQLPERRVSDLRESLATFMCGLSPNTLKKTRAVLDRFITLVGNLYLAHINRSHVMDFRAARAGEDVSVATVNSEIRHVSSALGYAVDAGWLELNPLLGWKKRFLREPEQVVRVVEPAEFDLLLAAAEHVPMRLMNMDALRVLLKVSYFQGLRRHELVKLLWTDIDFERNAIRVINVIEADELTKSRKNRIAPLRLVAKAALQEQWERVPKILKDGKLVPKFPHVFIRSDGKPWAVDWISHVFPDLVAHAGVPHCTLHDLRRSWSTLLQRAGVDRSLVKDMGGWSCLAVLEKHYTGEVGEAYRRAIADVDRQSGSA